MATVSRNQVQKGVDKLHSLTSPVLDPIMEAGQKISDNLGLPERVNKINEKVATPSVLVPAAFLGGAALALGTIGGAYAINRNTNGTATQVPINSFIYNYNSIFKYGIYSE